MTTITLRAKNLDPFVSYRSFEPTENKVLFMGETLFKEVMNEEQGKRLKKIKKLKKIMRISVSILATAMTMAPKVFAATELTAQAAITPAQIMVWGKTIALISVSAGIGLSMTMFAVAGIYRMFRKRREATEWTSDIIVGLVQVLIAIPSVYVLYFLAHFLFSHLTVLSPLF